MIDLMVEGMPAVTVTARRTASMHMPAASLHLSNHR
jgi:hypothetical protein